MLLLLALPASAQTGVVELQVYDHAGLSQVAVQSFVKQTQGIFSIAGVPIHIRVCARADACEIDNTSARNLMLRIVAGNSRHMNNVFRSPLGQSFADHTGGKYASVFLEAVQQQAVNNDVPWLTVLAYAAVHEIGHLLLGDQAHTPMGLMKAHWDKDDFRDMKQNRMHFNRDQVRQLARCCASFVQAAKLH
jgi:hypothetical protein